MCREMTSDAVAAHIWVVSPVRFGQPALLNLSLRGVLTCANAMLTSLVPQHARQTIEFQYSGCSQLAFSLIPQLSYRPPDFPLWICDMHTSTFGWTSRRWRSRGSSETGHDGNPQSRGAIPIIFRIYIYAAKRSQKVIVKLSPLFVIRCTAFSRHPSLPSARHPFRVLRSSACNMAPKKPDVIPEVGLSIALCSLVQPPCVPLVPPPSMSCAPADLC